MDAILKLDELNVATLDQVTLMVYKGTPAQRAEAQRVLAQFQELPDAWTRVDRILRESQSQATKFFALQVLQPVVQYRWKALPQAQREAIKAFILDKVVSISSKEETLRSESLYLKKLNEVLVSIIKQDWPNNWGSFVQDITTSSKTNEALCENNMVILKLLSEEIFDFSDTMTRAKTSELKEQFSKEFAMIYQLCDLVLSNSTNEQLLVVSLKTLLCFLSWIPVGYIFETSMVDLLLKKFFPVPSFRNTALACLTEIAALKLDSTFDIRFVQFFVSFMQVITAMIPITTDIAAAYKRGTPADQRFINNLAMFFTSFFGAHLATIEAQQQAHRLVVEAHQYLALISMVDDEETFKICVEYWKELAADLYDDSSAVPAGSGALMLSMGGANAARRAMYDPVLCGVRTAMISRMAKPEEVLLVEDENGEMIREEYPDSEAIILYNNMRETLIYLTHLNPANTIEIMTAKLHKQVSGTGWSRTDLNTLCWAIGSISGAQNEDGERKFLVLVLKDLLSMCEFIHGKDNKAAIASNIMYIVGQYPRFLRAHWTFLKTVIRKLFEFMHEEHPGVKDMACDTFLKISKSCHHKFVVKQAMETQPFINELLMDLPKIIMDLEASHIQVFYEAVALMISAEPNEQLKAELIRQLMALPNGQWEAVMANAQQNIDYLQDVQTAKTIVLNLKTNVRVAASLKTSYKHQLAPIFFKALHIYGAYSRAVSNAVAAEGARATYLATIRSYRAVKRESLRLFRTYIENATNVEEVAKDFVPPLLQAVLVDYSQNIDEAKDPEVLSLMTAIVTSLKDHILGSIQNIYACIFECTLAMIKNNFEDHPEHRVNFFNLIRAINKHCFQAFFTIPPEMFKLTIDSVVWAMKHTARNIADTGIYTLIELWEKIQQSNAANAFYKTFLISLLQDLFVVMTDTFHKSGFTMQATMIMYIVLAVKSGRVSVPLWNEGAAQFPNNTVFLLNFIGNLIGEAFRNLSKQQVEDFTKGLFVHCENPTAFKQHLRDFLVDLKEFQEADNSELFREEAEQNSKNVLNKRMQVPGLVRGEMEDGP